MQESPPEKLPLETPRRKRAKERTFYEACVIDGKFSPRCAQSGFMRAHAKETLAGKTVSDKRLDSIQDPWDIKSPENGNQDETVEINAQIHFKKRVELKDSVCEHHRKVEKPQKLSFKGHDALGPTKAQQLEAICLEPLLWMTEPLLKMWLRTPEVYAVGTYFHMFAAEYFETGRLYVKGRRGGLQTTVDLNLTDYEAAGLTYPLRINDETPTAVTRSMFIEIARTTERYLRRAIADGVLRSRVEIFKDKRVIWAGAEHRINVVYSMLLRDIFGIDKFVEPRFDPLVVGETDLNITRWLPNERILDVEITDFKTGPNIPDEETLESYKNGQGLPIQLPSYGLNNLWAHLSPWEDMPKVRIRTRYAFITDTETRVIEVPFNLEIAKDSLDRYYKFRPYQAEADDYGEGKSFKEKAAKYYPAVLNDNCKNCPAFGVCTETRPTDGPASVLDQLIPTKKKREGHNNLVLWT